MANRTRQHKPKVTSPPDSTPPLKSQTQSPAQHKFSFLDIYEHSPRGPWDILFRGDIKKAKLLNSAKWKANLETDPVKVKRSAGPTDNQRVGGLCVDWMLKSLVDGPQSITAILSANEFRLFLQQMTTHLFGKEQNSITYYRYYLACACAAVKWGRLWGQKEIAIVGEDMLCDFLALMTLHKTDMGIAFPGARGPGGVVDKNGRGSKGLDETYELMTTGKSKSLAKKKLDGGTEVHQWSLRELGRKFVPSPVISIRQLWPLHFDEYENGEWVSSIPRIRSYDPVIAVSYVGGRFHELKWKAENGRHKAETPRKTIPIIGQSKLELIASYPEVGFAASIPIPRGRLIRSRVIQ